MELRECIYNRRSVRKYLDLEVPKEMVGEIIEAGTMAPCAGNLQNWGFIIVKDKDARNKMADACLQQDWMANANVHIVVCGIEEPARQHYGLRGERLYTVQNCAAAIQNMLLTAHELGLGACWIGGFDEDMVKDICAIPGNVRPQAVLTFGIPDEKPEIPKRENIYNVCYFGEYDARVEDMDESFGMQGNLMLKNLKSGKEAIEKKTNKWMDKLEHHSKKFLKQVKEKSK